MSSKQIRLGQLIAPFGPGSIYTDRNGIPQVVAGLDFWHKRWDQNSGAMAACSDRAEFDLSEPRLSTLLRVDRFSLPPDYRYVRKGYEAPPNANLHVPALRFPCWYRHTKTGRIKRFNSHTVRIDRPSGGGRWQPVRFISVCAAGHLCEFPWKEWIGCNCEDDGDLHLIDRGGSELTSVTIKCETCPVGSTGRSGKSLAGTTVKPNVEAGQQSAFQKAGIACPGDRPWLGMGANEDNCTEPLVGALINQTNLYFPKTISALRLPNLNLQDDELIKLQVEIENDSMAVGVARTLWNMPNRSMAIATTQVSLQQRHLKYELQQIEEALESLFSPSGGATQASSAKPSEPEEELLAFRREEFNIIRNEINDPELVPDLRVVPTDVQGELAPWIKRINLVERLRETRVFYGFDRLTPGVPLDGMPESSMSQLYRNPPQNPTEKWLPAIKVYGEGLYIELSESMIRDWRGKYGEFLRNRIDDAFMMRLADISQTLPPLTQVTIDWASRYLLVHSLAHILINQLVFECGYSTASLRERLYVSEDTDAPMAAILIYTAAGDSEGTLGGLVRLGRPDRFESVLKSALVRASWCSTDPVCSENLGGQGSKLANLAACHACILLPETSCETINHGLDRSLLVGTPEMREPGFFAALLDQLV